MTNRDVDHVPLALGDTLDARGESLPRCRVRGTPGLFSIVLAYRNAVGERVVDCAGAGRRLTAVTLDRLEQP